MANIKFAVANSSRGIMPVKFKRSDDGKMQIEFAPWALPILISVVTSLCGFMLGSIRNDDRFEMRLANVETQVQQESKKAEEFRQNSHQYFVSNDRFEEFAKNVISRLDRIETKVDNNRR